MVDDVLGDAAVAVVKRMRSGPLDVDNPAAYGTRVICSVVRRLVSGRTSADPLPDDLAEPEAPLLDLDLADDLRAVAEVIPAPAPWVRSAVLTYLTVAMHPDAVPGDVPRPQAGSRPAQAYCWPALWFGGQRDVFPDCGDDPRRRTRARRINQVLDHVATVAAALGLDRRRG